MRINIKGDNVTPENIAAALQRCEKDYGLKIKGATIYVRFEDNLGRIVEPMDEHNEIVRDFIFRRPNEVKVSTLPVEPITVKEMIEECTKKARRALSAPEMTALMELAKTTVVDRRIFIECLDRTMAMVGQLSFAYFMKLLKQRMNQNRRG